MKLALVPLEQWEQINQKLTSHFSLPPENSLRVFRGLAHAAFEIVQGTAQFLSHKRNLGIVKGQTPFFEPMLASFYKDAYGVQSITHQELQDPASIEAWVNGLKKDTSFVMFAEDHPVTGELYAWEKLDELLNEKKIYSIRISHFLHFYEGPGREKELPLRPYSVRLCHLNPDYAVAHCGERFKVQPLIAPFMNWDFSQTLSSIQKIHFSPQDPFNVKKFEAAFTDLATPWFSSPTPRLYDRVLLKFKDISGEALLQALHEHLQMDRTQYYETLDTTDLCRWNQFKTFSTWWDPKPTEEDLQGLLVIDSGWLVTKDFAKILTAVCEEIRAQQSW